MPRTFLAVWLAAGAALLGLAPAVAQDSTAVAVQDDRIPGLVTYEVESARHSRDPIDYEVRPPAGGMHHGVWQNCEFYDEPVGDEHAVHSQEHGAVWITYDPDLDEAQLDILRDVAAENQYVLVSPYLDLPSPVVASAWGAQIALDGADDSRLDLFLREFIGQGPEPGAACSGGTSETVAFPEGTPVATPEAA